MNRNTWWRLGWILAVMVGVGCGGQEAAEPQDTGGLRVVREQALEDAFGSRGREFWLAFPTNYDTSVTLTVFITGETATTGTVRVPGQNFTSNFSVTPGQVTSVVVPVASMLATYQSAENKGVQVTAAADVTVYGLNRRTASTDAFLGLPVSSLGTEYMALAYPTTNTSLTSQLAVVATQDATRVTLTPSATTTSGQAAGVPFSVTLNKGQTYQMNTAVANGDVSGSLISADKPVAVFGGHKCANIPNSSTGACDFLVEQLPPLSAWGKSFVTVPLATRLNGDTFRFIASANGTQVSVNGTVVATLNRGQVHQRIISGSAVITSSQPILVAQYSNGTSYDSVLSDPFMMLIPPYEQFLTEYTMTTPASGFRVNYLNVVAPAGAVGAVTLDGVAIPAASFKAIGTSGFLGAQLSVTLGSHRLKSPLPIGAFMYGFDSADSYGYPGGMSLAPVASVASVTLAPKNASYLVRNEHCVTATVATQQGAPLAGVRVDLEVTGAHTLAKSGNSDAAGKATWCYTGANAGTDSLKASVGVLSDTASAVWTANLPPVVSAGPDLVVHTSALATLNGSVTDEDGDPLTLSWTVTPGADADPSAHCTFGSPGAAVSTFSCDRRGTFTVTLTARDAFGVLTSASAQVRVINNPPVVSAGPDTSGITNALVTLNGSAIDEEGDALVLGWTFVPGAGTDPSARCTFGSTQTAVTTFTCDTSGTYTATLTADDGHNGPVSATAQVTFSDASKVTACNLPRYTKNPTMNLCGYVTPGKDGGAISAYWFTVDGGAPIFVSPTPNNISSGFVTTSQTLSEGEHDIKLYALSSKGNVTMRQKTVTVDTQAPVLQVLSPTAQDILSGKTFNVVSAVADATPVTVTTQFVQKSDVPSGTGTVTHTVTVGTTGYSTVLVQARDAAGNISEIRVRVNVAP
ncbi:Ig-like domain-containing protein [Myxococcaceae bacterium GXIMD 01537]